MKRAAPPFPAQGGQPSPVTLHRASARVVDGDRRPLEGASPEDGCWCPLQGAAGRASPEQNYPRQHAKITKLLAQSKGRGWVASLEQQERAHEALHSPGKALGQAKSQSAPGRSGKLPCAPCSAARLHRTKQVLVFAEQAPPEAQEKVLREPAEPLSASSLGPHDQHQLGGRESAALSP